MLDALQTEFSAAQAQFKEEEKKKAIVLDAVQSKCSTTSEHKVLREMAETQAATDGNLDGELISGGKTNYSFKIFIDTDRSKAVYAKLFLPYAVWDEDRHFLFDVQRADSEYNMMKKLVSTSRNVCNVACPLFVVDVQGDAKLLVAEWAGQTEEQWGNQFIEGQVDGRVVHKVAHALAQLNLMEVEKDWNDAVRPGLLRINPLIKNVYNTLVSTPDEDCDALMKELKEVGKDRFGKVVDKYCAQLQEERQTLCHNDCHPFNILVEPKALRDGTEAEEDELELDIDSLEAGPSSDLFGPHGSYLICDWEMAICGPAGKDAGVFMAFPSACALCVAVQGHTAESLHLLDCAVDFWKTYSEVFVSAADDDERMDLTKVCRVALGNLGAQLLFYLYILGILADILPLNGVPSQEKSRVRGSIGVVGLRLLLLSYEEDSSGNESNGTINTSTLEGLQDYFKMEMSKQIEILSEESAFSKNLKSTLRARSVLRGVKRRVSDASIHEEFASRMSNHNLDWSDHNRVANMESSDFGASMASFVTDGMLDESDDLEVTDEMRRQWEAELDL